MGEMKATITAKNIEQIKSFLSRQKETYKVPYEVHPEDRPRQCVFCGTSNDLNFLPLDKMCIRDRKQGCSETSGCNH